MFKFDYQNFFRMKKIIYALVLFSVFYMVSCKPDNNDDPLSPTPSDERDKYVGVWLCNESSQIINSSYTISITKSTTNSSTILIDKFYNMLTQVRASVAGNSISIPYQNMSSLGFASGSGNLALSGTTLNMNYIVKVGSNPNDTCSAVCVKQ